MKNPLQTREWIEEIIRIVAKGIDEKHIILNNPTDPEPLHFQYTSGVAHRLRRTVLRIAREHLRHEKPVRNKDMTDLRNNVAEQGKVLGLIYDKMCCAPKQNGVEERDSVLAEITELQEMLASLPEGSVIDRMSLKARLAKVQSQMNVLLVCSQRKG